MNPQNTENSSYKAIKKRVMLFATLITFSAMTFASIMSIANSYFVSNVIFRESYVQTYWPLVIAYAQDVLFFINTLCVYSAILFACYRFSKRTVSNIFFIFTLSLIFRFSLQYFADWFFEGIPDYTVDIDRLMETLSAVLSSCLEVLMCLLFILICKLLFKKTDTIYAVKQKNAARIDADAGDRRDLYFPIRKMFDFSNPIQSSAFGAGLLIAISNICERLLLDITDLSSITLNDIFAMVIGYSSDILLGVIAYFAVLYILIGFDALDLKLKTLSK